MRLFHQPRRDPFPLRHRRRHARSKSLDTRRKFHLSLLQQGVSFEDRQDPLGHKSGRITTHYSQAELANLIAAAEKACGTDPHNSPASTWLRRKAG